MSRLDPAEDETREMRSRAPRPAIRVSGRLVDRDCFVALSWRLRKDPGGLDWKEFRQEVRRCLAAWRQPLPPYDARKGNTVDE